MSNTRLLPVIILLLALAAALLVPGCGEGEGNIAPEDGQEEYLSTTLDENQTEDETFAPFYGAELISSNPEDGQTQDGQGEDETPVPENVLAMAAHAELTLIQAAMYFMMADKGLETVNAVDVATSDMSFFPDAINLLYPDYMHTQTTTNSYVCDANGRVSIVVDGF
ncbi:hypothetical protein ACFLX5_02915 [Chloroflexota bacterium]